jgi:UDP-N-acetylmuramate--alanine ligase
VLKNLKQIHFIGIGGYGMSDLALVMLKKGYRVSGSDIRASALTTSLADAGAAVTIGHQAQNTVSADLAIYSTAIDPANPELKAAKERGIPLWHRSELLAALLNNSFGIAIAGAHGKTTTTAMVALLLEAAGLDPTAVIGGVVPAFGSNARIGAGPYLVAEADESDRSFTRYYPKIALVTGIEPDHLEHYNNDYASLQQAYARFLSQVPTGEGLAVLCADEPALRLLGAELNCRVIYYSAAKTEITVTAATGNLNQQGYAAGLTDPTNANPEAPVKIRGSKVLQQYPADKPLQPPASAEYSALNIRLEPHCCHFDLAHWGSVIAPGLTIGVPGLHNVSNVVGALAVADQIVSDLAVCTPVLKNFNGAGRRFEKIGEARGITVIDDYAHHPTEIKATLETARLSAKRVLCLFQPHRYSRTAALYEQFATAFSAADQLFLHEIYPAGEQPPSGISSAALAAAITRQSKIKVTYNPAITALEEEIVSAARPGDLIITMGAGDITYSAPRILELLKTK